MQSPSPRYIITRALFFVVILVVALFGMSFLKKKQRQWAIAAELKLLAADASFFQQFYPEEARKTLVKAIGLIAEAKQLGLAPDAVIERAVGIEHKLLASDTDKDEPPPRVKLVQANLRMNYENFRKLGYMADYATLDTMKKGTLPLIPSGPPSGKKPDIAAIIDPSLSPGIDRVIANLEIRPPQDANHVATDLEKAAAKQLVRDLTEARLIEEPVRNRILEKLEGPAIKP